MGVAIYFFGAEIRHFLEQYLGLATVIIGVLIVAAYIAQRYFERRLEKQGRSEEE